MRTIVPVTAVVLAGGTSRRMGQDKRLLVVEGSPLIRRVVESLMFSAETFVVQDPSHPLPHTILDGTSARLVADRRPGQGPLAGLETGLAAAQRHIVVVVGADMPWLEPALLVHLADSLANAPDRDAVVARTVRGLEPLLAAYRRDSVLARAIQLLDAGERRLGALLDDLSIEVVDDEERALYDPTLRSTHDIDTPADLVPRVMTATANHTAQAWTTSVITIDGGIVSRRIDTLAGEEPLQILAAGPDQDAVEVAVTMRTPGHEDELAIGFLVTEGLAAPDDIERVTAADPATTSRPDDSIVVHLRRPLDLDRITERRTVATASCGICGKASIDEVAQRCDPLPDGPRIDRHLILSLPGILRAAQETFEATGGLHASGLFAIDGTLRLLREDVGRHNALDKVVGASVLAGDLPLHDSILLLSGRVSFELVQKAAVAGIPVLCAVGAPTDLAVATAERLGMTLVGFLRGERYNVYARSERLGLDV